MESNVIEIMRPSNSFPNLSQAYLQQMLSRINQWREATSNRYDIITRFFLNHAMAPEQFNSEPNAVMTTELLTPNGISSQAVTKELRRLKLKNKVLLTKSELMMIREKLS
jgi:uncharacterized protein with von Willebrand factor type A (vWA) domain